MRMSQLFGETLRAPPAEAETVGHGLLVRAGYIRQHAPGIFSYLPLGRRAMRKIVAIVRDEMEAIGGQEVAMPIIQRAAPWQRTGRWEQAGEELVRFNDRTGRTLVIGTTHEELAAELARGTIRSYRQLPALLYQIRTSFRDERQPRAGLLRAREFELLASYSFDRDPVGLDAQYRSHREAYSRIFQRLELNGVMAVAADPGTGEQQEHELVILSKAGDDTVALCDSCGYAANLQTARFNKPAPAVEQQRPLEKVATPGAQTIQSLAEFLNVPKERTAKVVLFAARLPGEPARVRAVREVVVMALVRGDMEVSERKLSRAINASWMRPADIATARAVGAVPGYASPVGLRSDDLVVVADDLVAASPNLICGANEEGFHLLNVNFGRDCHADVVADIVAAFARAPCPQCRAPLQLAAAVEIASLHRWDLAFSEALEITFQDQDGSVRPVAMGAFGIGLGRLLACIAEQHHDEHGLRLPVSVAPYEVCLVAIAGGGEAVSRQADAVYAALRDAGTEVLYDDRDVSSGVKFNDADLIGIPLRATLGARSLRAGGVELKRRDRDERQIAAIDTVAESAARILAESRDKSQPGT